MDLLWAEGGWRVSYSLLKIEVFQRSEPVLVQAVTRGASRGSPSRHSVARLLSSRRELALCRVLTTVCAAHTGRHRTGSMAGKLGACVEPSGALEPTRTWRPTFEAQGARAWGLAGPGLGKPRVR